MKRTRIVTVLVKFRDLVAGVIRNPNDRFTVESTRAAFLVHEKKLCKYTYPSKNNASPSN